MSSSVEISSSSSSFKSTISQLSFQSSLDKFKIWDVRFFSYISSQKADLVHLLSDASAKPDEKSSFAFSSLLIPFLADDIIEHFTMQLDLKKDGFRLYHLLHKRFAGETAETEQSGEELLLKALRRRRDDFSSIAEFLRDLQSSLQRVERAARVPFAERLLIHHAIQQLRAGTAFPWAASLAAKYIPLLRSDDVRRQPQQHFKELTLDAFVKEACILASAGTESTSATSTRPQCRNCGRFGHLAANCRKPSASTSGKQHYTTNKSTSYTGKAPTAKINALQVVSPEPEVPLFDSDNESINSHFGLDHLPATSLGDDEAIVFATAAMTLTPPDHQRLTEDVLVDTGAAQHMFRDRHYFVHFQPLSDRFVYTANGSKAPVLGIGTVHVPVTATTTTPSSARRFVIRLRRVLYVPSLSMNILSAGRWVHRANCSLHLSKHDPHLIHGDIRIPVVMPSNSTMTWIKARRYD